MTRVAITGATGMVGGALAEHLIATGYDVVKYSTKPDRPGFHYWNVESFSGDVPECLYDVDVLFHLAAYIPKNHSDLDAAVKCNSVNGIGTLNALRSASAAKIKRFFYISGSNLIKRDESGYAEESALYDCSYALPYFVSKALGELYVRDYNDSEMQRIIVRPSSLYSDQRPPPIMRYIADCIGEGRKVELYGRGEFSADYLHVEDLAAALSAAVSEKDISDFNIGTGKRVSTLSLAEYACKRKGMDPKECIFFSDSNEDRAFGGFGAVKHTSILEKLAVQPREIFSLFDSILEDL